MAQNRGVSRVVKLRRKGGVSLRGHPSEWGKLILIIPADDKGPIISHIGGIERFSPGEAGRLPAGLAINNLAAVAEPRVERGVSCVWAPF